LLLPRRKSSMIMKTTGREPGQSPVCPDFPAQATPVTGPSSPR
jgi:hypothetical protein